MRPLDKQEIDRRIEDLVSELFVEPEPGANPRWIAAGDLVRRMRPFLVYS